MDNVTTGSNTLSRIDIWLRLEHANSATIKKTFASLKQHTHVPVHLHIVQAPLTSSDLTAEDYESAIIMGRDRLTHCRHNLTWKDIAENSSSDWIVLADAGTIFVHDWLQRLSAIAEYNQTAGSLSPTSLGSSLHSPLRELPHELELVEIDRLIATLSDNNVVEVPYWLSHFFMLNRAILLEECAAITDLATDKSGQAKFAEHLYQNGHIHLLYTGICVGWGLPNISENLTKIQAEMACQFELAHPLSSLRYQLMTAISEEIVTTQNEPSVATRPVYLHLMHNWGGGLERWVEDYCRADQIGINLILRAVGTWGAFGQRLELHHNVHSKEPIAVWQLTPAIRATAVANYTYAMALQQIIDQYHVENIVISSLIGHSMDAMRSSLPTTMVHHDYYPFCQALYSFNQTVCQKCTATDLARCKQDNPANRFFGNVDANEWQQLRQAYLREINRANIRLVAPSPSVANNLSRLASDLQHHRFHIIPHGVDIQSEPLAPPVRSRQKILILGGMTPEKGLYLLRAILPKILEQADVYLIGCGDSGEEFAHMIGVTIYSRYNRDQLAGLIKSVAPDFGLLLSVVPETFSYTLSELFAFTIPVIATNIGSFADRIKHGETGLLPPPSASEILASIQTLLSDRLLTQKIRDNIKLIPSRSCGEMIREYQALNTLPKYLATRRPIDNRVIKSNGIVDRSWDPSKSFGEIILEAKMFFEKKIEASPRLRPWQRKTLRLICKVIFSASFRMNQRIKHAE